MDNPWAALIQMTPPVATLCLTATLVVPVLIQAKKRRLLVLLAFFLLCWPLLSFSWGRGATDSGVKIISFNVHRNTRAMPDLETFVRKARADVVILQEVGMHPQTPAEQLTTAFPHWHAYRDHENFILSRWPLTQQASYPQRIAPALSFTTAVVEGPIRFRLVTGHWTRPHVQKGWKGFEYGVRSQLNDYRQTIEILGNHQNLPLILAGDFNLTPRQAIYRHMKGRLKDCWEEAGFGPGWTHWTRFPMLRIDHVFVSPSLDTTMAIVGPNLGSDHFPLLVGVTMDTKIPLSSAIPSKAN